MQGFHLQYGHLRRIYTRSWRLFDATGFHIMVHAIAKWENAVTRMACQLRPVPTWLLCLIIVGSGLLCLLSYSLSTRAIRAYDHNHRFLTEVVARQALLHTQQCLYDCSMLLPGCPAQMNSLSSLLLLLSEQSVILYARGRTQMNSISSPLLRFCMHVGAMVFALVPYV